MTTRFYTYDEACLFASMKRAEGYFAEVIHQNAGHIWGSAVVCGFPVLVSEEVLPEDATAPEVGDKRLSEFAMMVGMFGLLGFILSVALSLYVGFFLVLGVVLDFLAMPVSGKVMSAVLLVAMFLALWGMLRLTRIYNRPNHRLYNVSRFILRSVMWFLVVAH